MLVPTHNIVRLWYNIQHRRCLLYAGLTRLCDDASADTHIVHLISAGVPVTSVLKAQNPLPDVCHGVSVVYHYHHGMSTVQVQWAATPS